MFSVVTGWPDEIGLEMITNPKIELITFTGSVPVGKYIAKNAGYKRTVLELGGNDPLIVLNDLDDHDLLITFGYQDNAAFIMRWPKHLLDRLEWEDLDKLK